MQYTEEFVNHSVNSIGWIITYIVTSRTVVIDNHVQTTHLDQDVRRPCWARPYGWLRTVLRTARGSVQRETQNTSLPETHCTDQGGCVTTNKCSSPWTFNQSTTNDIDIYKKCIWFFVIYRTIHNDGLDRIYTKEYPTQKIGMLVDICTSKFCRGTKLC
jgi:hypothetical protein